MKKTALTALLFIALNVHAGFGGMGNVESDGGGGGAYGGVAVAIVIIGGFILLMKENGEAKTSAARASFELQQVWQQLADERKKRAAEQKMMQTEIVDLNAKLAPFHRVEILTKSLADGDLSERDYFEMVIRIVDPSFEYDLGPYHKNGEHTELL